MSVEKEVLAPNWRAATLAIATQDIAGRAFTELDAKVLNLLLSSKLT